MKKGLMFIFIILFTIIELNSQMILTGVIDGPLTGGTPKAIEFYVTDNIADLSIYGFGSANNGGGSDGEEFTFLPVTATEGDFIYVATESIEFTNWFGFAPDYTSGYAASINGDDAIELFMNSAVIDVFGDIDTDGTGEPWEYMDGWAYRNDGTGPDGSTWTLANWYFSGPNALDGETNNATATTPFPARTYTESGGGNLPPTITDIAIDPTVPKSTDTVNVSANIEDVDGTIASASLFWGLSSGSLTNEITMTATRANYETTTPIPAQSQGITVYYKIRAIDNEPDTTFTSQRSYSVAYERTIYEIQYTTDPSGDSPDVGNTVITFGVVTAAFTGDFVLQDGFGAWNGVWVNSDSTVLVGDEISLGGTVSESFEKTILTNVTILQQTPGQPLPSASTILTADVNSEQYEGVYVFVDNATCTNENPDVPDDYGEWEITSPGSDPCRVDDLGYAFEPTLGSIYDVTGVVNYSYSNFKIEPRDSSDVVLIGDFDPPAIQNVVAIDSANVEITFSEDVEEITAETTSNYSITSRIVTVTAAVRDVVDHSVVNLTVNGMIDGNYLLTVINVEDLYNNAIVSDTASFSYTAPQEWDVIINEIDADTPGIDSLEFIELFDGGTGNTDLTGLVVVLFNGSDDQSYLPVFDLDGYSTDVNGYFVLGNSNVANVDLVFAENSLQNGADAVALYQADAFDFPNDTPVTTNNLIDAIVYDTNDADDAGLLVLLNAGQPQVDENGAGDKDHHSNQRIPNGSGGKRNTDTYEQHISTPGEENSTQTNYPPDTPVVSGPLEGVAGVMYEYVWVSVDPEGDDVFYYIDWGDGGFEDWIGPYVSGVDVVVGHVWEMPGDYVVVAKAKDIYDAESDWSDSLVMVVTSPYSPPEVWITDPTSTSLLYEPSWQVGVVTHDYATIRAFSLQDSEDVVNVLFEYSADGTEWTDIGVDDFGGFEGYIVLGGGDNKKIGDEGWSVSWDVSILSDGDYFVRATMTDAVGGDGSLVKSVHVDHVPPVPDIVMPVYGEVISGLYDFIATCDATDVVQMEVLLFNDDSNSSGWFYQSGIGNTTQGPMQSAPTAAANALAGLNNSDLYPAGQAGNGNALRDALGENMGTDTVNGTNTWRRIGNTSEFESDNIGAGLRVYLRKRGLGCSNSDGYEVTTFGTKLKYNASTGGFYPVAGSNEIDWDDYDSEIRKGGVVILDIRPWNPGTDGVYGTEDDTTGGGHAVTGQGSNSDAMPDGSHDVGINDPVDGQNHVSNWNSTGGFSRLEYPPGSVSYWLITGMWSISPINMTTVLCSSVGIDYVPEDGFSVSCETTAICDGTHVFIVEMTDIDGFIGSDTVVVFVGSGDITPPENVIITQDGSNIVIIWNAVPGASSYKIYSDPDPYGTFSNLEATVTDTTWSEIIPIEAKKFYRITAE